MNVGYNKTLAVVLLLMGLVSGLLGIASIGMAPRPGIAQYGPIVAGVACVLNGSLMLSRPLFTLEANEVVIHALLGPLKRRYPFGSKRAVTIADGKLFVAGKKLPVTKGRSNRKDWEQLVTALAFE